MNGRTFTPDDVSRLRRLAQSGMTDGQIAEDMNRSRSFITEKRAEHRIEPGLSRAARAIIARLNLRAQLRRAAA